MTSPKARNHSQTERLVFSLRERILRGDFAPASRLTELRLVPLLGGSRTPVRLALERLAHQGLLDPLGSGGFRVRSFTLSEVLDAVEIRGVLEGTAVRLAAERLQSSGELSALRLLLTEARLDVPVTVESFGRYLEANDRFHQELWRLSKSPPLVRALEAACHIPFAAPGALVFISGERISADTHVAAEHHRAIVEAIAAREGARGEALAREHTRVGRRTLELAIEQRAAMDHVPGARLIVSRP